MKSRMERYEEYWKGRQSCNVTALDEEYVIHHFTNNSSIGSRIAHLCPVDEEVIIDRSTGRSVPQAWYILKEQTRCSICSTEIPKRWRMLNKLFRMKGI